MTIEVKNKLINKYQMFVVRLVSLQTTNIVIRPIIDVLISEISFDYVLIPSGLHFEIRG